MTTLTAIDHKFEEDEDRSRFDTYNVRWVGRCKVCRSVGYLYADRKDGGSTWRHKAISKARRGAR